MLKIHHTEHFSNTIRIGKYNTDTKEVICEETGETYPSTTLFAMDHYKKSYGKPEWERVMLRSKDWDVCMIEVEPEVRWISSNHLEMYNLTQRVKHLECQLSLLMKNAENKNIQEEKKEESKEEIIKENVEENKNIQEENKEESKEEIIKENEESKNIQEENKEESKEEIIKENEESKENKKENSDEESKEEKEDKPKGKGKDKSKKNKEVKEVKENIKDIRDIRDIKI